MVIHLVERRLELVVVPNKIKKLNFNFAITDNTTVTTNTANTTKTDDTIDNTAVTAVNTDTTDIVTDDIANTADNATNTADEVSTYYLCRNYVETLPGFANDGDGRSDEHHILLP